VRWRTSVSASRADFSKGVVNWKVVWQPLLSSRSTMRTPCIPFVYTRRWWGIVSTEKH